MVRVYALITRTRAYTNMRMRAEGGGEATSNTEPDYITHVHVAMASRDDVDQLLFESVVRGYHVFKTVWTTSLPSAQRLQTDMLFA